MTTENKALLDTLAAAARSDCISRRSFLPSAAAARGTDFHPSPGQPYCPDNSQRAETGRDMARGARNDGGTILPLFHNFVHANRPGAGTPKTLAASWEGDGARAASRWWFT